LRYLGWHLLPLLHPLLMLMLLLLLLLVVVMVVVVMLLLVLWEMVAVHLLQRRGGLQLL